MRTCYGKLSKLPTGSCAQELTQKDGRILDKFSWLRSHISRQKGKQLGGLTEKLSTGAASRRLSSGEDSDDDTGHVVLTIQEECTPSKSCLPEVPSGPTSSVKLKSKSFHSILKERTIEYRRLQEKVEALISDQDTSHDSRMQYGLLFASIIPRMDEKFMNVFMDDSYRLLMQYVRRSEGMKQQYHPQPAQQYHPQPAQQYHPQPAQQYPIGQPYPPP